MNACCSPFFHWTCTFALLLVVSLTGCHRTLMRQPIMFDQTLADPFDELPADQRHGRTTVFYATNRQATPGDSEGPYGRSRAAALTLGQLNVEIGDDIPWDELVEKTVGPLGTRRPPLRFDEPAEFGPLLTTAPPRIVRAVTGDAREDIEVRFLNRHDPGRGPMRFAQAVNDEMAATNHDEIYVYVHGYRNSFNDAIESAASLHHYNGRRGVVIAFAWPSQKHLLDYLEDRESATFAVSDLRQFLVFLADHTDARRINIIAHSMGTFLTANTLREMRLIGFNKTPEELKDRFRLDNVVLVAPDIDADVFGKRFFREGFHHVPRRLTVYNSPNDQALAWASRLLFNSARAGSITGSSLEEHERLWLKAHPNVALIDITGQKTYGLGHSHHTENPGVASDLLLLLAHRLSPAERGLTQNAETGVWRFPGGYDKAVQQIAERYYPLIDHETTQSEVTKKKISPPPPPASPSPAKATATP
ncbi:MAG: alpha/beta hydrolase [Planctomycetota bacterium]